MSKSVTLTYTPTEQDYAAVLRAYFWQRTETRLSLAFLVIAFLLVVYVIAAGGVRPTVFELAWLIFPPAFVIFILVIQPRRMAIQAGKNEQLTCEATWVVSDLGVQIKSRFSDTQLAWENMLRLVKTREYYLLPSRVSKNAFRFLPRRAFTTPQDEEIFLELAEYNIPRK